MFSIILFAFVMFVITVVAPSSDHEDEQIKDYKIEGKNDSPELYKLEFLSWKLKDTPIIEEAPPPPVWSEPWYDVDDDGIDC